MSRSKKEIVYRAGTEECPSFDVQHNPHEVWLVTNPDLYYPLDQFPSRHSTRSSPNVCLWKTDITKSDTLIVHPKFEGVCQVELNAERASKLSDKEQISRENLKEELRSLKWEKTTVEKCRGGMSLMNFSTLVQAVIIYMKDHYPNTPEEFNFQAELKAASHWHWSDKEKERPLQPGPHDNCRVKIAADFTSEKWENELKKMRAPSSSKTRSPSPMKEDRRMSDLEEGIFALKMYYDDTDELDCDEATGMCQSPSGIGKHFPKKENHDEENTQEKRKRGRRTAAREQDEKHFTRSSSKIPEKRFGSTSELYDAVKNKNKKARRERRDFYRPCNCIVCVRTREP